MTEADKENTLENVTVNVTSVLETPLLTPLGRPSRRARAQGKQSLTLSRQKLFVKIN